MNNPLVSIIIVNYDGKKYLQECLKSIVQINYPRFEIILVDNNSIDDSVEFVRANYPDIDIIELDKNYGFAEPNNMGAKNAKGEYLLFLNNDTIVTPSFLSELIKVITNDPKIAICQSLLLKPNNEIDSSGDFVDTLGRAYSSREKISEVRPILSARGASMIVRTEAFWELGGFDKDFFVSFEDVDLGWRAWICGYKVVLVPKSIVYHTGGQTIQKLNPLVSFHGVKNTMMLRLVNFETTLVIKSIVILFFVIVMRKFFNISVIKDPETSKPLPSFKIIFRGLFWIINNLHHIKAKRKIIKSKRILSTKDLIKMGLVTRWNR